MAQSHDINHTTHNLLDIILYNIHGGVIASLCITFIMFYGIITDMYTKVYTTRLILSCIYFFGFFVHIHTSCILLYCYTIACACLSPARALLRRSTAFMQNRRSKAALAPYNYSTPIIELYLYCFLIPSSVLLLFKSPLRNNNNIIYLVIIVILYR